MPKEPGDSLMPSTPPSLVRFLPLLLLIVVTPSTARCAPSPELAKLCDEYWQGSLRANPTYATSIGERRFDALLPDITPAGIDRERKRLEGVLARARSLAAAKPRGPEQRNPAVRLAV